ncbi:hypothetical protein CDL15_Pgr014111 [Punica granatum]|uniref:Uncharacterized protein n=1 Tax=Punica granatum TaxID=22663 RepID=A0A218VWE7_PUNGR|nr:hypothetical protein CDL15_Pgr014111 [Punica granatum]
MLSDGWLKLNTDGAARGTQVPRGLEDYSVMIVASGLGGLCITLELQLLFLQNYGQSKIVSKYPGRLRRGGWCLRLTLS